MKRLLTFSLLLVLAGLLAFSLWSFWLTVRPPRIAIPGTPAFWMR